MDPCGSGYTSLQTFLFVPHSLLGRIRIHITANFPLFPHSLLVNGRWRSKIENQQENTDLRKECVYIMVYSPSWSHRCSCSGCRCLETIQEINTLQHTQHRLYFRCLFFLNIVEKYLNNALQEPNRIKINVRKCTAIMCQFFCCFEDNICTASC